jgi:hypothetical protein
MLLTALLVLAGLFAFTRLTGGTGAVRIVWLIIAAAALAGAGYVIYLVRGLSTLRYYLGRQALTIEYLGARRTVPYETIIDIVYAPHERVPGTGWERYWPGFNVSTRHMVDGLWHSWATQPPQRRVRVITRTDVVAITPNHPVMFVNALTRRCWSDGDAPAALEAGRIDADAAIEIVPDVAPAVDRPQIGFAWTVLFRERLLGEQFASILLAAGVVLPFLIAGYLYSQYEGVPSAIPLHFDAHGQPDRIGEPRDLWVFPIVAVGILAINTALATFAELFDRFIARLILIATPVFQLLAFIALVRLMNAG